MVLVNQPKKSGITMVIVFCDWSVVVWAMENHIVTADRMGKIHGSGALRLASQRKLLLAAPKANGPRADRAGQGGISSREVDAVHSDIDRDAVDEGALSHGAKFLEGLVSVMGLDAEVYESQAEDVTMLEVEGKSLGMLIGRHGETLDSIQYLVNLAANRAVRNSGEEDRVRYVVDVAGYRRKREETLRAMAAEAADKVIGDKKRQVLEPMSALERRIVHMALKDVDGVVTHSEGREPYRRIVISPSE